MIRLSKIPHSKIKIIQDAITYFIAEHQHEETSQVDKLICSISQEFYHKQILPIINKQYPSQTSSLKMHWHVGFAVYNVFLFYKESLLTTDYPCAVITLLTIELGSQI